MPPEPPDFDRWFTAGAGASRNGARFALYQDLGWLWLPSGRLLAVQPVTVPDPDRYAFVQTVPVGRYPVSLLIADDLSSGDVEPLEYVAAARLVVRDEPAATWELAVPSGRDHGEGAYGFAVDGGQACFTDAQTMLTLDDLEIPDTDGESWSEVLSMDISGSRASLATLTDPGQDEEPVVVGFSTGDGDGRYPTWVGRTSHGDISCFVTDFMLAAAALTAG